jgi:hypothetical protein
MSDYISSKQFLSLDKKVQDSIMKWWEPELGTQVYSTGISSGEYVLLGKFTGKGYYAVDLETFDTGLITKG